MIFGSICAFLNLKLEQFPTVEEEDEDVELIITTK